MKRRTYIHLCISTWLFIGTFLLAGCEKEKTSEHNPNATIPVISTTALTAMTGSSVQSGGNITSNGGARITVSGICWGTTENPTAEDHKTTNGPTDGAFASTASNLESGVQYYVRAYATNSAGTAYGNTLAYMPDDRTIKDIDGNVYTKIAIGGQVWTLENLRVTRYRNGDPIPDLTTNDAANAEHRAVYGRLYTWYDITDSRNIAPEGWRVATNDDWLDMETYLGGIGLAAGKLKEAGTAHFMSPNVAGTNSSGFTALPGGLGLNRSTTIVTGISGFYWTSTDGGPGGAYFRRLHHATEDIMRGLEDKNNGMSVRLIKIQ